MRTSYKNRCVAKAHRIKRRKSKRKIRSGVRESKELIENGYISIGPGKRYKLGLDAINHILHGDFSERLIERNGRKTGEKEKVLSGGLHTYNAWIDFKASKPNLTHLRFYNSENNIHWYYARELQNGVITLRIPVELFQSKAANSTSLPENYYVSGYLWKTLFPKTMSREDIISIIDEALFNIDQEESDGNELVGYALASNFLTAMKIRILVRGDQINSAFPTWTQPYTGNNGKIYSHFDAIGFVMADSTELFDENSKRYEAPISKLYDPKIGLTSLINSTPKFFLKRSPPCDVKNANEWVSIRSGEIENVAREFTEEMAVDLVDYLKDNIVCKENFYVMKQAYNYFYGQLGQEQINAFRFTQNIIDGLSLLFSYDDTNKTSHFWAAALHILRNKITFSGWLDSWNNKRIHGKIIDLVSRYHKSDIIPIYILELSLSPTRRDFFVEFDLNTYWKRSLNLASEEDAILLAVMHNPTKSVHLEYSHFVDYSKANLGENYLVEFTDADREGFVERVRAEGGENYDRMINDSVAYTSSDAFDFISEATSKLVTRVIEDNIDGIDSKAVASLCKDVFRIQTAQRMRITLEHPEFSVDDIDYGAELTEDLRETLIIKHRRRVAVSNLEDFLNDVERLAIHMSDRKLELKAKAYKKKVWTERPPMLRRIPDYIKHWAN